MPISRMDLADAGSPDKIVQLILEAERDLPIPVPIEALCRQLDIEDIQPLTSKGFEGGLITDADRSFGFILASGGYEPRRRFTVAHELGHFLMPKHVPDEPGRFLCSRADMLRLDMKEADRRARMEAEANRFASLILMPPAALRRALGACRGPDLQHVLKLAKDFDVSKEAMGRAYTAYHDDPVAIVVTKDGRIQRYYKHLLFPFIVPAIGTAVPSGSLFHRGPRVAGTVGQMCETAAEAWVECRWGVRAPTLYEQVYLQKAGFALILLHVERRDGDENLEERDLEESWRIGFPARRSRR